MSLRLSLAIGVLLALWSVACVPPIRAEDPRVIVYLRSADSLTSDLQHLCADLAEKPREWSNNVFPNIDVFLFGVDRSLRPIRYDQLIGAERGRREQIMVPIDNLNAFIDENLASLGIVAIPVQGQNDLYALGGPGFVGWMRIKDGYAVIADVNHLDDIPPDMPSPADSHSDLLKLGYDFAVQVKNSGADFALQAAAFAARREHALDAMLQRDGETPAAFALRRLNARHSLETRDRLLVDSSLTTIGFTVDSVNDVGTARLVLSALPDTPLARMIERQARQPSRFAGVAEPDDAVLAGRLNYALSDSAIRQFAEFCRSARLPLEQQIESIDGLSHNQKQARRDIARLLLDGLASSLDLRRWDGLLQIGQHAHGTHSGLLALGIKGPARVTRILELLPVANSSFQAELNVDAAGDVAIHRLTVTANYPQSLQDFFGPSRELYIGTGADTIWISIGEGALDVIRQAVAAAAGAPLGDVVPSVANLDLHLLPVLQLLNRLQTDCDFDLLAILTGSDLSDATGEPSASLYDNFDWRDISIKALQGADDRLHFDLQRIEDRLEGNASITSGILQGIGAVIAEFARQRLG